MESYKYYQFVNTLDLEPFALGAYHFWGVFKNEFIHGSCGDSCGFIIFSDFSEIEENEKEDLEKIIKKRIEELEEEEDQLITQEIESRRNFEKEKIKRIKIKRQENEKQKRDKK